MDVLVEGFEAPTDAESADTVEAHAARDRISVGSGNAGVGGNSTRSGSSLTTSSSNQEKHFLYHSENRLPDHDEENVTRY
ncbi:hypothetical protein SARC_04179 [Sphaeroforma arctica JP610]|uniref:Uncharacterized protein n=1 Tax=Sphaeroforma arctica JP610 TaxID=667725 RepID=A0A0L0G406_9EUKA|nr:hypothetical protein SARC_04179 [Sphaeroforma arctica JP610]KNC83574.1 hypothetical protein SARC_04179 [Sphaeroforma arctica JP610]|eukprot:XP_014157476.1 hypothetical protein SARC_04179 [Sphaeroforma arctica JP610]